MKLPDGAHTARPWRIHELTRDPGPPSRRSRSDPWG
jgi:hypothetical protein